MTTRQINFYLLELEPHIDMRVHTAFNSDEHLKVCQSSINCIYLRREYDEKPLGMFDAVIYDNADKKGSFEIAKKGAMKKARIHIIDSLKAIKLSQGAIQEIRKEQAERKAKAEAEQEAKAEAKNNALMEKLYKKCERMGDVEKRIKATNEHDAFDINAQHKNAIKQAKWDDRIVASLKILYGKPNKYYTVYNTKKGYNTMLKHAEAIAQ